MKVFNMSIIALALSVNGVVAQENPITFSGYIDVSLASKDTGNTSEKTVSLERYELQSAYQVKEGLNVVAHITGDASEDLLLEQAHIKYQLNPNTRIVAGKFLSAQGWEAYHSPDLFQYSYSSTLVYPAMMNGVSATYSTDKFSVYGAVLGSAWDSTDVDAEEGAYEAAVKLKMVKDVIVHLGHTSESKGNYDQSLTNLWASWTGKGITVAAEYNVMNDWEAKGSSGQGWLLMGNYQLSENAAITLRTSALVIEDINDIDVKDLSKWTISPTYFLNKQWKIIAEYSKAKDNTSTTGDTDLLAIKSIVTF